jgi:hypothetical protein
MGGATLLAVFGLLFILRGQVAVGIPGLVIGVGALVYYRLNRDQA